MAGRRGVKMYLDADTYYDLTDSVNASGFVDSINAKLKLYDKDLHLASVKAYGSFPNFSHQRLAGFKHPNVSLSLNYLPKRLSECDPCKRERKQVKESLSYLELKSDIAEDVGEELQQDPNGRSPVAICSSDLDFVSVILRLRSLGYKVILFTKSDAKEPLLHAAHLTATDPLF